MSYAQFTDRSSLRDIEMTFEFNIPQTLHTKSKSIGPLQFKQDDIHTISKVTKELNINSPESQYIEGYLF